MASLPRAKQTQIDIAKVTGYLLSQQPNESRIFQKIWVSHRATRYIDASAIETWYESKGCYNKWSQIADHGNYGNYGIL